MSRHRAGPPGGLGRLLAPLASRGRHKAPRGSAPQGKGSLGGAFVLTMAASGGTILLSLISGILTARFLGTFGRGEVAAIQSWTLTLAWASVLGFPHALVYFQSKGEYRPQTVISTALSSIPMLGLFAVAVAQALIPLGFAAQTEATQQLARIFLCGTPLIMGTETVWRLLMAAQRFAFLSILRVLQPALYVLGLVTLLAVDEFRPFTVLAAQALSYGVTMVVGIIGVITVRLSRPSWELTRRGLVWGLRLQGVALGQLVTARLDLMLLPAFVAAADVGFYSVAVNVTSMIVSLFGSLNMVVFPVASSKHHSEAPAVVQRGLRLTLLGGSSTAIVVSLLAPWLISFLYGPAFLAAVLPLWLMMPGIVAWAGEAILSAGLGAVGRPGLASIAQIAGMAVTVIGLVIALPRWGIEGAAVVSSVAYIATFTFSMLAFSSASGFSLRQTLSPSVVRTDIGWVLGQVKAKLGPGTSQPSTGSRARRGPMARSGSRNPPSRPETPPPPSCSGC